MKKRKELTFAPQYDASGNQTLVKTATGLWNVVYDANNRPVSFTKTEGETTTVVECGYDYQGRRYMKKVTVNGTVTLHHRYLYRGYLQIACCDLTRAAHPCLWLITWDPTEPVASRPLALQKDGTWYCYGLDITKNVWELFGPSGYIRTAYDYTPYGGVTEDGDVTQPIQWSSEVYDEELALVYYNYRHYNPMDGRWINRDPIAEQGGWNLYEFVKNDGVSRWDYTGKKLNNINLDPNHVPLIFVTNLSNHIGGQTLFQVKGEITQEHNTGFQKVKPIITLREKSLVIKINKNLGSDPNSGRHVHNFKGIHQTTESHERNHAKLYINGWNEGIDGVNKFEQNVCPDCHDIQSRLLEVAFDTLILRIKLRNVQFDENYSMENVSEKLLSIHMKLISLNSEMILLNNLKVNLGCLTE